MTSRVRSLILKDILTRLISRDYQKNPNLSIYNENNLSTSKKLLKVVMYIASTGTETFAV